MDGLSAGDDSPPLWDLLTRISRYAAARKEVSDLNQALMELGALVCTPRSPSCGRCPLEGSCLGLKAGVQEKLPLPRARRAVKRLSYAVAVVCHQDRFLLARNRESEFLKGMWEFPRIRVKDRERDLSAEVLEGGLPSQARLVAHRIRLTEAGSSSDHLSASHLSSDSGHAPDGHPSIRAGVGRSRR